MIACDDRSRLQLRHSAGISPDFPNPDGTFTIPLPGDRHSAPPGDEGRDTTARYHGAIPLPDDRRAIAIWRDCHGNETLVLHFCTIFVVWEQKAGWVRNGNLRKFAEKYVKLSNKLWHRRVFVLAPLIMTPSLWPHRFWPHCPAPIALTPSALPPSLWPHCPAHRPHL